MNSIFRKEHCGCYVDGVNGESHRRKVLIDLVEDCCVEDVAELIADLQSEPSDDYFEEDKALDLLNEHCDDDVTWVIQNGDLLLLCNAELDISY